jgi:hypothetical protein
MVPTGIDTAIGKSEISASIRAIDETMKHTERIKRIVCPGENEINESSRAVKETIKHTERIKRIVQPGSTAISESINHIERIKRIAHPGTFVNAERSTLSSKLLLGQLCSLRMNGCVQKMRKKF